MQGTKKIQITWEELGISVKATLLSELNPILCEHLWGKLPLNGIQDHALVSGEYLYGYVAMPELCSLCHYAVATKECRSQQDVGRINLSVLQHFSIKYGEVEEYLKASPVAQVETADLDKLCVVGKAAWESTFVNKRLIVFSVTRWPSVPRFVATNLDHKQFMSAEVAELVSDINSECGKIWLNPPEEVVNLLAGRTNRQLGSFGFYFHSVVFADGLLRALGCMTLGDILRMVDDSAVSIASIQETVQNALSPVVWEFLEYCGFEKLFSFFECFRRVASIVSTREDLRDIVLALINYVNRFSGWMLHYFPWKLGSNLSRGCKNGKLDC